jgi:hypothetical protein
MYYIYNMHMCVPRAIENSVGNCVTAVVQHSCKCAQTHDGHELQAPEIDFEMNKNDPELKPNTLKHLSLSQLPSR